MADNPTTTAILSNEFVDTLSSQMLVVPDTQFVFARWAMAALAKEQMAQVDSYNLAMLQLQDNRIATSGDLANVMSAMSSGMGGPLQLANLNLAFPDLVSVVREAAGPGTTIRINKPRFIDGLTTEANRSLTQVGKLFTNSQAIGNDQVSVTIAEYAGPGDTATGAPTPVNVSLFLQHRSKHDVLAMVGNELRRDRYKFVDDMLMTRLIASAKATTGGTTRGADVTADAAFTGGGNEPMSLDLVLKAVEAMKDRSVPGIASTGSYVMVLHQHQIQQLKNDPAYKQQAAFHPAYNVLFPGYAGTIENTILVECSRLPKVANLGAGANLTGYQGLVLAPGAMGWACAKDAFVTRDKNDDGGRFAKFAWIAFEGYATLQTTFTQLIVTT